jgi:hypothetical protein
MTPNKHGGGPHGSTPVGDTSTVVQAQDDLRSYLEIQNIGSEGCYLAISNLLDAVDGSGLYLAPDAVYTIGTTNLTPARVSAVCAVGLSTTLNWQVGR